MTGNWIQNITQALGPEFFTSQAEIALTVLNILSGSLALDSPLPPYIAQPADVSFRVLVMQRMPEELAIQHVGENGFSVFATLAVSARLITREIVRCVELVRSLVGEVDLGWHLDEKKDL